MICSSEGNVTHKECTRSLLAVGDALYAIGGKWKLPIIIALREWGLMHREKVGATSVSEHAVGV